MYKLWNNLPLELVIYILSFDIKIKYYNGKFMNQILDINKKYYNLLKKISFKKYFIFNNIIHICYINIYIGNTNKCIYYYATDGGYRVTLNNENEDNYGCIILYNNII